jgi:enoyl-CoA hydratase/carnithine racemase
MADSKVRIERQGAVAVVTLNDPATRNALSPAIVQELSGFFAGANADDTLGCIVLAAAGEGFCSGGNVKAMHNRSDPMFAGTALQQQEGYRTGIQQIPRVIYEVDVPIVAAVHGAAIGAGMDLACMCDIRIAATDAKFAESFLRVGLVSGDGGAWFLPRVVGMPRALEMALTCRVLDAAEAKAWGLITHVVEPEKLLDTALDMARKIAAFPPRSARLNKRLLKQAQTMTLSECLDLSAAYQALVQSTADQKEAVAALLEKRAPKYVGR